MFEKITIRTVNPDGWPVDFSVSVEKGVLAEAIAFLGKHGYTPARPATANAPAANGSQAAVGSFAAEQLTATVDDGKVYWKVKGANYQKFGVTVWPEVLEASGFDTDTLNPLKPVDLVGYTAVYATKENGQPKKIIKLERPA